MSLLSTIQGPADLRRLPAGDLPLLAGRYRVRRALGLPMDAFDEETDAIREAEDDDELD